MKQYLEAVREILNKGTRKENRTGVDTISTFNINYEIDLREGFPILTTKKIDWKNIVVEVLWFLSGELNINLLKKHGCHFWDAWGDNDGRVPSAYGNFWRHFPVPRHGIYKPTGRSGIPIHELTDNDQIAWAVAELKKDPMSRRVVISAWAPGNAQTSKLPPCHITWVLNVQNMEGNCDNCKGTGSVNPSSTGYVKCRDVQCDDCKGSGRVLKPHLCLHLTQRSCDIALGVPYNIATYALLQHLISKWTGIPVGIFAHTLVDAHAYTCKPDGSMAEFDHIPGLRTQLEREPLTLPKLELKEVDNLDDIEKLLKFDTEELMQHFILRGYTPWPVIKFKVAV